MSRHLSVNNDRLKEIKSEEVRNQRNQLLISCDWTMIPDATTDKEAWGNYRKALRDITTQEGFPLSVVWPVSP